MRHPVTTGPIRRDPLFAMIQDAVADHIAASRCALQNESRRLDFLESIAFGRAHLPDGIGAADE